MKFRSLFFLLFLLMSFKTYSQHQKDRPLSTADDLAITRDSLALQVRNKLLCPVQIHVISRSDNKILQSMIIPPLDSVVVLKEIPEGYFETHRIAYYWGDPATIKPDLNYPYRLPFKKGKKIEVSQSFNGKSSHQSISGKYAIDFVMPVGTKVYAAREGQVIKVIDWFTKHGGQAYVNKANKIIILHKDGTMASYVHLDYQGSVVQEGQWVEKGAVIGYSGFTGKTSGPHLHFVVRKDNDIAIPVYFEGYPNQILKAGKRYKAK